MRWLLPVVPALALAAAPADHVVLSVPPPLAPKLAALPRIAEPSDGPGRAINAALGRLDAAARKGAADCRAEGKAASSWERSIDVPMRGPRFLSYVVTDDTYCGGAHPNVGTFAVVYDLRSGEPVDWAALLPAALTGKLSLMTSDSGTRTVQLASPRLRDLYLEGYRGQGDVAAECRDTVKDQVTPDPPGMTAWLDGKRHALMLYFDLPHAVQACAAPVAIPVATLRREGASAELVEALEAGR